MIWNTINVTTKPLIIRELVKKEKELKKDTTKVSDDKKKERLEKADSAFKRIASESKGIVI